MFGSKKISRPFHSLGGSSSTNPHLNTLIIWELAPQHFCRFFFFVFVFLFFYFFSFPWKETSEGGKEKRIDVGVKCKERKNEKKRTYLVGRKTKWEMKKKVLPYTVRWKEKNKTKERQHQLYWIHTASTQHCTIQINLYRFHPSWPSSSSFPHGLFLLLLLHAVPFWWCGR